MKKIFILILTLLMMSMPFCGCTQPEEPPVDLGIDEETAIAIASKKLEEEQSNGFLKYYGFSSVSYDSEENVWRVSFTMQVETEEGTVILSPNYIVEVSRASGEIIEAGMY